MKSAKIVTGNLSNEEPFNVSAFGGSSHTLEASRSTNSSSENGSSAILDRLDVLSAQIDSLKSMSSQQDNDRLNQRVVEALTSLNNHSKQLDKIVDGFESKLISYALKIATNIIGKEIEENSSVIALGFTKDILVKLKDASKVSIHVSVEDYEYLLENLDLSETVELVKDTNIQPSGIVVSSDIGNFDSTVESKLKMLEQSLEAIV